MALKMNKEILIAEISGKRPGDKQVRKTERFSTKYDYVIISNNSDGYITEWPIVNVPDDYRDWYVNNVKCSDNAWYAPMNRSYAIKYAREHGYKYLIQLDDNIKHLEIGYICYENGLKKRYRITTTSKIMDEYIDMLVCVLKNTNAGMAGCRLAGIGEPNSSFLVERYCYSFFALNLDICPSVFQGDFEDDIEYRLKLAQMGIPAVQVQPLMYSKTGQARNKDLTGCRAEYLKAGLKRGEHMKILYGDLYDCKMRRRRNNIDVSNQDEQPINFKHYIKPFKVGVVVNDMDAIKKQMQHLLKACSIPVIDKAIIREKKVKLKA